MTFDPTVVWAYLTKASDGVLTVITSVAVALLYLSWKRIIFWDTQLAECQKQNSALKEECEEWKTLYFRTVGQVQASQGMASTPASMPVASKASANGGA